MSDRTPNLQAVNTTTAPAARKGGPKTEEGKKRVRFNAFRHGLTGRTVVMPWEDVAVYQDFFEGMMQSLKPVGEEERQHAQTIADCHWKLRRGGISEINLYVVQHQENENKVKTGDELSERAIIEGTSFRADAPAIANHSLYLNRIENLRAKSRKALDEIQARRKEEERQQMKEAAALLKAHPKSEGKFNPAEYGFEFSVRQIEAYQVRKKHWNTAGLYGNPPAIPRACAAAA